MRKRPTRISRQLIGLPFAPTIGSPLSFREMSAGSRLASRIRLKFQESDNACGEAEAEED
jgi:hypothetical protein